MTKHAVYLRLSKPKAGATQTDDSIEAQRGTVHKHMLATGVNPADAYEFVDVISANRVASAQRPAYGEMLQLIESGEVGTVWARQVDRLYRRVSEIDTLADLVERTGVKIETAWSGSLDLNTAAGRTSARIMASIAQGETETMRERIKARLDANRAAGKPRGGVRAFGWNGDGSLKEDEADLLRTCLKMILDGETIAACAKMLRDAGATSPRGLEISHSTLSGMLRSPKLVGVTMHNRQPAGKGFYTPITDEETFAAVQTIFNQPKRGNRTGQGGRNPANLLSGIAECSKCGRTMQAAYTQDTRPRKRTGEVLNTKILRYRCPKLCTSISRTLLDSQAVAAMVIFWMNADFSELAPSAAAGKEMKSKRADLAKIEEERAGILRLLAKGLMNDTEAEQVLENLNARRATVTARIEKLAERFTLATTLAPVMDGNTVNLGNAAALAEAFKAQPLERQRQQLARVWRPVVRPVGEVGPTTVIVHGTEYLEELSGARKQERRTRWECLLNPNLSFDPVDRDRAELMEMIAQA